VRHRVAVARGPHTIFVPVQRIVTHGDGNDTRTCIRQNDDPPRKVDKARKPHREVAREHDCPQTRMPHRHRHRHSTRHTTVAESILHLSVFVRSQNSAF
jgi:hypothetical protein